MGCNQSSEIDSTTGRKRCRGRVSRKLLIFVRKQNTNWRGQPIAGSHYVMESDLDFDKHETLSGFRIQRPLQCSLELANAVGKRLATYGPHDAKFVCAIRSGRKRVLPPVITDFDLRATPPPDKEVVLIQQVWGCNCNHPETHDITVTADGEDDDDATTTDRYGAASLASSSRQQPRGHGRSDDGSDGTGALEIGVTRAEGQDIERDEDAIAIGNGRERGYDHEHERTIEHDDLPPRYSQGRVGRASGDSKPLLSSVS